MNIEHTTIPECCDGLERGLSELANCAARGESQIGTILDAMLAVIQRMREIDASGSVREE
jgi:hypothetical protein